MSAIVAIIIGTTTLAVHRDNDSPSDLAHTYVTHEYQQAIVNFVDGTRVTLAPQTVLRVLRFGPRVRTVSLDKGEALFEVTHASEVPFAVRSGPTVTHVLGTTFLIRYDPRNPNVRVAVSDGKVQVSRLKRAGTDITLTKMQVGDITDSTVQVSTPGDMSPGVEWAPGQIMFRHTPLSAVLRTVSEWYGYQFRCADRTLGQRKVTMIVSTRSSAEALAEIEELLAVNLTVVGDTVTLVPQPARLGPSAPRIRTYDVWTSTREVGR